MASDASRESGAGAAVGKRHISGWFSTATGVFKRSGTTILPLFLVTTFASSLVVGALSGSAFIALEDLADLGQLQTGGQVVTEPPMELFAGAAILASVLYIVVLVLQMVAYGGATYIATRQAAGLPVTWGQGLRYGFRRCAGLLGWQILTAIALGIPFVLIAACMFAALSFVALVLVIPLAAYAYMVAAMVGPAYLFERGNALGRSFRLFGGAPRRMMGRLALVGLVYVALTMVIQGVSTLLLSLPDTIPLFVTLSAASLVSAVVELPAIMILFVGILVTYAERRGDEGSLTSNLVSEL